MILYRSLDEAIWLRVRKCNHGDDCPYCCWEWKGDGRYGRFTYHSVTQCAHRTIYERHNKYTLKKGEQVLHRCDVSLCCNPMHLFKGTQKDNILDCVNKGRHFLQNNRKFWYSWPKGVKYALSYEEE
jgi:HNH endonuclease